MTRIDVQSDSLFKAWVRTNYTLAEAIELVPAIWEHLSEELNNAWVSYCDEYNGAPQCPSCGVICKDDVTIADHGMCIDCFHERQEMDNEQ